MSARKPTQRGIADQIDFAVGLKSATRCSESVTLILRTGTHEGGSDLIRGPPVRGSVAAARLPGCVGADVAAPLGLCKIVPGTKAEGSDQLLPVNKPEPDLSIAAAAGQPPIRQHRQRPYHRA